MTLRLVRLHHPSRRSLGDPRQGSFALIARRGSFPKTVALMAVVGCAASAPAKVSGPTGACTVQLSARAALREAELMPVTQRQAPPSLVVVHAEAALAPLKRTLEGRIQQRVAEGTVGIGPGGVLRYVADRGALSVSTSGNVLVVETPIDARVEACRGARCYASCQPRAVARAEVPLLLAADYRFQPSRVTLRFGRGCKVGALGGLLSIDVTPTLEAQLAPKLRELSAQIDRQLPDMRAKVESAWRELLRERDLPLGGCAVLNPVALIQGPIASSESHLRARFAIKLTPELGPRCGARAGAIALPPLSVDPALPAEGVVRLGMVMPLSGLQRGFDSATVALDGKSARVASSTIEGRGGDVDIELELTGEVCGALAFTAQPDFSGSGAYIGLSLPRVTAREGDRWRQASLEPNPALEALGRLPRVAPLLSVQGLGQAVPALASAQSTPELEIGASVSSARPAGAAARGDELVAWLEARGNVTLTVR
jgi:Domain of unknown function (DUF4403)